MPSWLVSPLHIVASPQEHVYIWSEGHWFL